MKSYAAMFKVSLTCLITITKKVQQMGMAKEQRTAFHTGVLSYPGSKTSLADVGAAGLSSAGPNTSERLTKMAQRMRANIP